jgi:hypothetical protein
MRKDILLATPEWLNIQYNNRPPKPISELVMDIIVFLINITSQSSSRDQLLPLQDRLQELWRAYRNDTKVQRSSILRDSAEDNYSDGLSALTILYFNSASVLLLSALPDSVVRISESSGLSESCNSIMACVKYLEKKAIGCAYLRMMFPLVLVALKSPSTTQQLDAYNTLETWKTNRIMPGLCSIALHGIQNQSKININIS